MNNVEESLNKIPKVISDMWKFQESKTLPWIIPLLQSSFQYIDVLFELVDRIKEIISHYNIRSDDYRWLLWLFLMDIITSIKSGFSLLLRGNPKHALACFRPGVESVFFVWHLYLDKSRGKVKIYIEGEGRREFDELGREIKVKEKQSAFSKAFTPPYPEDNWPLYELNNARKDFSDWGSHSGIRGLQFYNIPIPPTNRNDTVSWQKYLNGVASYKYSLRLMNSNFLKMSRHMLAVICKVFSEAFPSQAWETLDISILNRIIGYILDNDSIARRDLAKSIIDEDTKISMKSKTFEQRSLEVGFWLNQGQLEKLIEWIENQDWEKPLRAQKLVENLSENELIHVRKQFENTGSRFLDAPDGFPEP